MCLQVEVEAPVDSDSPVYDRPVLHVPSAIGVFRLGRVEAGVMSLRDDEDCDFRMRIAAIDLIKSFSNTGKFLAQDGFILALRDAVSIH